tara:strand:+ start:484 stop:1626 length:1143 start_codon:yes stop_codon:yes gene_type:complete
VSIEFKEWGAALLHILYRQIGRYAGARPSIALVWFALSPIPCSAQAMPDRIAYELSTRYTPYADGAAVLDLEQIASKSINAFDGPLASLHLALDPGHVGGIWAEWEWRNFRISEKDYWIREGELVLEVAQRIRTRLTNLGAEVTLLREDYQPINLMNFIDYWPLAATEKMPPTELSFKSQLDHALKVRNRAIRLAIVRGEIAERARLVNEVIRPDVLISLHINAAEWPDGNRDQLVDGDHAHVLIFGCLSETELASPNQQIRLLEKLSNGSGTVEAQLGAALGSALIETTGLPASDYQGRNAIRIDPEVPSLWARNLMLLRLVDCPTVLMEPYITNSHSSYARIQKALRAREYHEPLPADDILVEYADAVVTGLLRAYER